MDRRLTDVAAGGGYVVGAEALAGLAPTARYYLIQRMRTLSCGFLGHPQVFAMTDQLQAESLQASLTVASLERSVAWYTDVLGFDIVRRHERENRLIAVSLQAGAVRILLTQDDGAKGLERLKGEGLSLQFTTHQNADALATAIKARGATLDSDPITAPHGARVFRLRDPDGFRLTISSTHAA